MSDRLSDNFTPSVPVGDVTYICGTCGEHLQGAGVAHSCAARIIALQNQLDVYRDALHTICGLSHQDVQEPYGKLLGRIHSVARRAVEPPDA